MGVRSRSVYVHGDAAWAACLMTDLASHGVEVRDATGSDRAAVMASCGGVLVVHSWFAGYGRPTPAELALVGARGCRIVVARRNARAVILHADLHTGVFPTLAGHFDRLAVPELDGVRDQVQEDLPHPARIGHDARFLVDAQVEL